jgi:hypothetical protein
VASVAVRRRRLPTGKSVQVERTEDGTAVAVNVLKRTRVDVVLRGPTTLLLPDGPQEVTEVRFDADDPAGIVAAARERLGDRSPEGAAPIL